MNLFSKITKGHDDQLLLEEGIIAQNGRLTPDGRALVLDLMFQGTPIDKVRTLLMKTIKEAKND